MDSKNTDDTNKQIENSEEEFFLSEGHLDRSLLSDESSRSVDDKTVSFSTFEEANFNPELLKAIKSIGWENPTPVQGLCLPYTTKNANVAGFAQTGTGKTGVFLTSIAHKILEDKNENGSNDDKVHPLAVVLAPTRELAIQIQDDANKLYEKVGINSTAIFGGIDYQKQANQLKKGTHVIIATPGRLKDFSQKGIVDLTNCKIFVCDEVDRMFDMGFIDDVEYFLEKIPENSQKLLFSATTNENVKELAFEYLDNPKYISVNTDEITPESIEQHAILCDTPTKLQVLLGLIKEHNPHKAIIFTNTKLTAQWLCYKLKGNNIEADIITGDLPQRKRIQLISKIKQGKVRILIATDVASRGLHVAGVSHVYNFDIPDDPSNYIHRIGRTARAGAEGASYSLVCDEYGENFQKVQKLLEDAAPKSVWFNKEYLSIEDIAGNPFLDNFGVKNKPKPAKQVRTKERGKHPHSKERHKKSSKRNDRHQGHKKGKKHHDHKKKDHVHKKVDPKPQQEKQSTGGLIKKVISLFFGKK